MKSKGLVKSMWMPQVEVLKDMKKQLEELKLANANGVSNTSTDFQNQKLKNGVQSENVTSKKKKKSSKVSQ